MIHKIITNSMCMLLCARLSVSESVCVPLFVCVCEKADGRSAELVPFLLLKLKERMKLVGRLIAVQDLSA